MWGAPCKSTRLRKKDPLKKRKRLPRSRATPSLILQLLCNPMELSKRRETKKRRSSIQSYQHSEAASKCKEMTQGFQTSTLIELANLVNIPSLAFLRKELRGQVCLEKQLDKHQKLTASKTHHCWKMSYSKKNPKWVCTWNWNRYMTIWGFRSKKGRFLQSNVWQNLRKSYRPSKNWGIRFT